MRSYLTAGGLICATVFIQFWLGIPLLHGFSLQLFALVMCAFFVTRFINRKTGETTSFAERPLELLLLHTSMLLIIGSTGGVQSLLFPLVYAHLFILVFSASATTAGITMLTMVGFYYLLNPALPLPELVPLIFFPVLWGFFTYAKKQHEALRHEKEMRQQQQQYLQTLDKAETALEVFLVSFVQPKLQLFGEQFIETQGNSTLRSQLSLLQSEVDKMVKKMRQLTDEQT